jgi:ketosteroid isomerase-like protein
MTVHPNVQLLRDYWVAHQQLDREALTAQFTTDARWWAPISTEQRGWVPRPIESGANIVEMLMNLDPLLYAPGRAWTVQHVLADDEIGAAHVELVASLAGNGKPYRNRYVFFYRFVNGQIAEVWEYTDTDYAYGQFGDSVDTALVSADH